MIFKKKEKESNYALIRRFNRDLILDGKLNRVKEKKEKTKPPSRREIRESAQRREEIRKTYQAY